MTTNQIEFAKHVEQSRHNREMESQGRDTITETKRSNVARETETNRSNVANESIKRDTNTINMLHFERMDAETERSNRAREAETARANRARESIDLGLGQANLGLGYANLGELNRHQLVAEATNLFSAQELANYNRGQLTNTMAKTSQDIKASQQSVDESKTRQTQLEASANAYNARAGLFSQQAINAGQQFVLNQVNEERQIRRDLQQTAQDIRNATDPNRLIFGILRDAAQSTSDVRRTFENLNAINAGGMQ